MSDKTIYLSPDLACWTDRKIRNEALGGAENFFWKLYGWLVDEGHHIHDPVLDHHPGKHDLTIHSNAFNLKHEGRKNLLWCGSWTCTPHEPKIDKVIMLSEFMKQKMNCDRAIVISAPYDPQIEQYKGMGRLNGKIVTSSNPNRWFSYADPMMNLMAQKGMNCTWEFCGGNRLYGDGFGECFNFNNQQVGDVQMVYRGVLNRNDLYGLLSSAHVWIYPNFSDASETFCVSMIEAAVLGIPVILPNREPFISVLPGACFVNTWEEMVEETQKVLEFPGKLMTNCETEQYSEAVVKPQLLKIIEEML